MNQHTLYIIRKWILKARQQLLLFALLMLAGGTLLTSCNRDELCFFHPNGANILVEIDWDKLAKVTPNAATLMIYNSDDGSLFREEILTINRNRHTLLNMPVGRYDFVVFNETRGGSHFDQTIGFRSHQFRENFEAFVLPDELGRRYQGLGFNALGTSTRAIYTNPDTLAAERLLQYEVTPRMINIVHVDPEPMDHGKEYPISDTIRFVPQRVISVANVVLKGTNLSSIATYSCYLTGMCEAYSLGVHRYSMDPVVYPVVFNRVNRRVSSFSNEVLSLSGSFSVMGLQGDISPDDYTDMGKYVIELRMVLLNGDIQIEKFDLIKDRCMTRTRKFVNSRPHDLIDIELKVDLPDISHTGDGLITDIENWDDQTVHLESTVLRFHPNQGSGLMTPIRRSLNTNIVLPQCEFASPTEPKDWKFRFKEWNTQNDGKGTAYQPGDLFKMPRGGAVVYAIWEPIK